MKTAHDGIYHVYQGFLYPPEGQTGQELYEPGHLQSSGGLGHCKHEDCWKHILCVSDAICIKISKLGTTKEMWELLWTEYGIPDVAIAFSLFKSVLDLHIPSDQHSRKVLNQLQMYFIELKDAKFKLLTKTQIMLFLAKLSSNMEVVAQKVTTNGIMDTTIIESFWKLAILSYKQCTTWHRQVPQSTHK